MVAAVEEYSFERFKREGWPATTYTALVVAIVGYLVTIYALREFMKNRKRMELNLVCAAHNFFLSALSLVMFLGLIFNVYKLWKTSTDPWNDFLCDSNRRLADTPLNYWTYIFYLSKYYELLDTVIIVLKKRPLIFLHVYHHIITMVLVYVMMDNTVAVRWLPSVANCLVHIPMYYYYGMASLGISLWWKKYITKMQISQFVIDVIGINGGIYYFYHGIQCASSTESWIFGQSVIVSFLVLFINFYRKTYNEGKALRPAVEGTGGETPKNVRTTNTKPRKED